MNSNTYCNYPYVDISFRQSTKQNRIKEMLLSSIHMRKKVPTYLLIPKAQCLIFFFSLVVITLFSTSVFGNTNMKSCMPNSRGCITTFEESF